MTQDANDKQQLTPMIEVVEEQFGDRPTEVLADSGYCSEANLTTLATAGLHLYLATGRLKHGEPPPCPRGPLPKDATWTDRMRRKLQTQPGKNVYRWRKAIVEPVFGQIKHARGFRQFLLRGFRKVQGEWTLVCLGHNVVKFHGLCVP